MHFRVGKDDGCAPSFGAKDPSDCDPQSLPYSWDGKCERLTLPSS